MSSQPLVCPQELSLEPGKKGLLVDYMDQVKKFGFDFDEKLRLTQVPRIDRLVLGNYHYLYSIVALICLNPTIFM